METVDPLQIEKLLAEIRHYLALVELLRREGYEPRWQSESSARV